MTAFQVLFIAGITNIVFLLLVLASCRCMDFSKITRVFTRNQNFSICIVITGMVS